MSDQRQIDEKIISYYAKGGEEYRLQQGAFRLEWARTMRLLAKWLPPPPARLLDVGGAAGAYAFPLTQQGYQVHLLDPVPLHIDQARRHAATSGIALAGYELGDARALPWPDDSVDAVLLLGPLYHLQHKEDRLQALSEARRVLKPDGIVMAAAIGRYASLIDGVHRGFLRDPQYREKITRDLQTGCHLSEQHRYFTTAYLHKPDELRHEMLQAAFREVSLMAVEGPVWDDEAIEKIINDVAAWKRFLEYLEELESDDTLMGASAHIMAAGRK